MAKSLSEEELQLKKRARRRLIGAILLVTVVAVVLPMILDTDPKPTSGDISIQIPSPDSKGFVSKVVPLQSNAAGKADKAEKAEKSVKADVAPKEEKTAPAPAETAKPVPPVTEKPAAEKPTPKPAPAPPKPEKAETAKVEPAAKPATGTFFIQVTALADQEKVTQVRQRLTDAGIPSYTQAVTVSTGKVTRVRAGPFKTRDEAEQARAKLGQIGFEGKVAAN